MGTRVQLAVCSVCEKAGIQQGKYNDPGEFWIKLEWMTKEQLLKHLQDTHCPICAGDDWTLTDCSEI